MSEASRRQRLCRSVSLQARRKEANAHPPIAKSIFRARTVGRHGWESLSSSHLQSIDYGKPGQEESGLSAWQYSDPAPARCIDKRVERAGWRQRDDSLVPKAL